MVGAIGRAAASLIKFFMRKWLVALGTCILLHALTNLRQNVFNFQSEVYGINERLKLLEIEVEEKSKIIRSLMSATSNLVTKHDFSLFQAEHSTNGNSEAHRTSNGMIPNLMDASPRKNFASFPAGANILQSWTSPTWYRYLNSDSTFINKRSKVEGNPPITVLISDLSLGVCWPFSGEKGQIGIQLSRVIHITGITISHVSHTVAYDIRTAPNKFELWGLGLNHQENLDLLHVGTYDIKAAQNIQYFAVSSPKTSLYSKILVKIRSNHGNHDLTCVYQISIHGETQEHPDGIENLPKELNYIVPT
ncbi:hypothetical protein PGT21_002656 [Puccinia graminis f. sp. tritici]|uniref:SUN domain-containing protein n=2 Tax=Puccinia graminis f. sp. tritici TaxID=56615 RepID=E3L7I3_PUCGT|nr:uncharacterized protein PGTG_18506 [Puccinia graminis f. sp. tritici CRL 75-36-700-3]EFP92508.1 hypothetical protein PGTG_18506 [Puccinia graminis f. sp. tritici CRL 75-36-700-3]KAA1108169.1 hypothetical protein PGT21_002656 [Puccinia graminis f. sp. tritici]